MFLRALFIFIYSCDFQFLFCSFFVFCSCHYFFIFLFTVYLLFMYFIFGGGCFFLACEDFWMFDHSFSAWAFYFYLFIYLFLKWRLARAYLFHSACQDQSTVAQRTETTLAKCSLTSCVRAHFRIGSHTLPGRRHSQPTPTSLSQGRMRF